MESKNIIHVVLKNQKFEGQSEFYFGSVAAVYETLNPDILGIKHSTLVQYLWHRGGVYENEKCRVTKGEIMRKSSIRRNNSL